MPVRATARRIIPLNKGFLATEAVYSVYCAQSIPVAVIYIVMDCAQPSRLPFALFNGLLLPAVVGLCPYLAAQMAPLAAQT